MISTETKELRTLTRYVDYNGTKTVLKLIKPTTKWRPVLLAPPAPRRLDLERGWVTGWTVDEFDTWQEALEVALETPEVKLWTS